MKLLRVSLFVFLTFPLLCPAQRREYVELQREVALMQDQMLTMQRSTEEKLAVLTDLLQQALDSANKANAAIASMDSGITERLLEQEKSVATPVVGMGAKVDQMASDFQSVREAVADMNSRLGKLQQQVVDLDNAVRTVQAPPPSPPVPGAAAAPPPSDVSATNLYQNALGDKNGGKLDLALQEFNDYLQYFPTTEMAPNAQYYIGEIHYNNREFEEALAAFDLVLEKYPQNEKTADSHYMKGRTLVRMKQNTDGAQEFYTLIERFPDNPLAAKAMSQLKALGLPTVPPSR